MDRGHQDKLTAFKQEIRVILKTLQQQRLILIYAERIATACRSSESPVPTIHQEAAPSYLVTKDQPYIQVETRNQSSYGRARSSYGRDRERSISEQRPSHYAGRSSTPGSQIDPTDPGGVQGLLIQDSYALIDRKMRLFEELRIRAEELVSQNNFKIDYNKDRQDSAIYAFTIVTIIFLPLSTVAGILGMNTNDVRNMHINQWVFWATALPLTVIVITLCLIWAGELENLWKGFSDLWRGNKRRPEGGEAYSVLGQGDDAYSMMDPRAERLRSRYVDDDSDEELDVRVARARVSNELMYPERGYRTLSRHRRYDRM